MKTTPLIAALVASCLIAPIASAESYDQTITAIFGSGNPDTGWTTGTGEDGITLALRAKNRETGSTANVSGTYYEPVGLQAPNNNRARWNWEFSVDSGPVTLDQYDYYIGIDLDTPVGISHQIVDVASFPDNSYGTAATLNGQGVEGPAATFTGTNTIAQQSQNLVFWAQDPTVNATYDYELFAVAKGAGYAGEKLASTTITVIVGSGGAPVNDLVAELAATAASHGDYVSSVNALAKYLMAGGIINKKEATTLTVAAAKSSVGK